MTVIPKALPTRPEGPIIVVGAGKAAGAMAQALEAEWGDNLTGLVITRDGYAKKTNSIEVVEAAHPVPDKRGEMATRRLMTLAADAPPDSTLIGLWSGGASSLLVQPASGLTLQDKQDVSVALLKSGVPIEDINVVRKHLSRVKGGRLALLAGQTPMLNLIISDVVGDDLTVIGSGPTVADCSTCDQALEILKRLSVSLSPDLLNGLKDKTLETPDRLPDSVQNHLIATPVHALKVAAALANEAGCDVVDLGDALVGEARDLATSMAQKAMTCLATAERPVVLLSGGEVTVALDVDGVGGPNLEFCLALAVALDGHPNVWALACDTDGTDGASLSAGAIVCPDTLERAACAGRDPAQDLDSHNSELFFESIGDLVTPGPTATNVNDFRAVLILPDV